MTCGQRGTRLSPAVPLLWGHPTSGSAVGLNIARGPCVMAEWACGDQRPWALLDGVPALPLSPLFWLRVAHRSCHSFLLDPSVPWTKPSPTSAWRKPTTFPLQVWQPLHIWLAWGSPKIHVFISHGREGRSQWASALCNHDRCLCPSRTQSLTWGLTCFSPHLLLTLPASEHLSWVGESYLIKG